MPTKTTPQIPVKNPKLIKGVIALIAAKDKLNEERNITLTARADLEPVLKDNPWGKNFIWTESEKKLARLQADIDAISFAINTLAALP